MFLTDQDLSCLVDGECTSGQLGRVLHRLRQDGRARGRVSRWSLVRDVLQGVAIRRVDPGFADRVMAALPPDPVGDGFRPAA